MVNKSVNAAHSTEIVNLKSLDEWLNDLIGTVTILTDRVAVLEKENSNKDKIIANLNHEIDGLKKISSISTSTQIPQQAAAFWSAKNASITKQLCNQINKENKETTSKKNNVIIFGLEEKSNAGEDLVEIKNVINFVESSIDPDTVKVNRFKSKNNDRKSPVQVVFDSEEDKMKVLKSSKNLRVNNLYTGVYINPDLTKLELEATKKLNQERKALNDKLPFEEGGKKYGKFKFGTDQSETKFFWGIRDFKLTKIKIVA